MIPGGNITKYLSRFEIETSVQGIAEQINRDFAGQSLVLVAVLKGDYVFLADLVRYLKVDFEVEFVRVRRPRLLAQAAVRVLGHRAGHGDGEGGIEQGCTGIAARPRHLGNRPCQAPPFMNSAKALMRSHSGTRR